MSETLEDLLKESRSFPPSEEFTAQANAKPGIHAEAEADFQGFWHRQALDRIDWYTEPTEVLDDSNPPFYKWFSDGELNLSYNCLDRHLESSADRSPITGWGSPATLARSPMGTSTKRCAGSPTP